MTSSLRVGFADGRHFVSMVGNFVPDGRRFAPGLGQHVEVGE